MELTVAKQAVVWRADGEQNLCADDRLCLLYADTSTFLIRGMRVAQRLFACYH
jgi:hypothetical protein